MMVAGISVADQDAFELARLVSDAGFADTAEALVVALEADQAVVALSVMDREAILFSLSDPPEALAGLRDVLLAEHMARVRD